MDSSRTCLFCGGPMPKTRRKYCSDKCCMRACAQRKNGRRSGIDYNQLRRQKKRHRKSSSQLAQINQLARESGMTYGQFVGKMYAPVIERRDEQK